MRLSILPSVVLFSIVRAASKISPSFTIDVHSHIVPDFYRQAMIDAGYSVRNGTLWADGTVIPPWTIEEHFAAMKTSGVDYAVLSISAPGVTFLHSNSSGVALARKLNNYMYALTKRYPKRLGAFCHLPLPNVTASLAEISYCLDVLNFPGVGLFTNHDGQYLGDARLDPILSELNTRNVTTFVHPNVPDCWEKVSLGYVPPMFEFPFDTTRAIINLFFTGARKRFGKFAMIFSHGGGTIPFLSNRVSSLAALPLFGGFDKAEVEAQFKSYWFDMASGGSKPQMAALAEFVPSSRFLVGTDFPFVPPLGGKAFVDDAVRNGGFNETELRGFKHGNALSILPRVKAKLERRIGRSPGVRVCKWDKLLYVTYVTVDLDHK